MYWQGFTMARDCNTEKRKRIVKYLRIFDEIFAKDKKKYGEESKKIHFLRKSGAKNKK